MNILAICSALNNSYLALQINDKQYSKIIKSDKNYHSLYLISKIKELCNENNFELSNLNAIAVNCGQGSFTGIRVAMSVAKIMAGELNLPLIGLNTTEILLNTYGCNVLLMDARRDMFFFGTKEKTELILKEKIKEKIINNDNKIVCDKNSKELFDNSICYEEIEKDLGLTMLNLASDKLLNTQDLNEFNYLRCEANYIQTPPVF